MRTVILESVNLTFSYYGFVIICKVMRAALLEDVLMGGSLLHALGAYFGNAVQPHPAAFPELSV